MEEGQSYIKVTTTRPPFSRALLEESKFPLACILKPLTPLDTVPTIASATDELIRCTQCKGYLNPYVQFIEKGSKWVCNLCRTVNPVPNEYFSPLDANGKRSDLAKRPELQCLSLDICAPESYMSRPPMPCVYVFLIDISINAQTNEFISIAVSTISDIISSQSLPGYPRTEVALLFFDKSVHFISFRSGSIEIFTENDVQDIFLPTPSEHLLISLEDIEEKLIAALEFTKSLPNLPYSTCYIPALRAAGLILQKQGGKIVSFCGEMLSNSSHPLQFTMKPSSTDYQVLGQELSSWNVACSQYIKSSQYCNLQNMIELSRSTGGQVYFYPNFSGRQVAEKLRNEIRIGLLTLTAWESTIRLRISSEWAIKSTYGHFSKRPDGLIGVPVYTYPHSFVYEISPLSISYKELYLQSAMLYTNCEGERKLRIHNLKLLTTEVLADVYENADCDAIVNVIAKNGLKIIMDSDRAAAGAEYVEGVCKDILQNCIRTVKKQPERLEFFCASVLGLIKHYAFMHKDFGCKLYSDNLNLDMFFYFKQLFECLGSESTGVLSYPRLYPVANGCGAAVNLTYKSLETTGAYLLDTGVEMFLWVGKVYIWIRGEPGIIKGAV